MQHLLRIADLTTADLSRLLRLATTRKHFPHAFSPLLEREVVVCYFAKPSTRTRLSFETAIARLGGAAAVVGTAELQLGRGETIADTARVVSSYARAFVVRTSDHDEVVQFAEAATVPVVNALTDLHHPCQALADLLTLEEHYGQLAGLKVAYVGDGNNVAHSLIEACALAGVDIAVATPAGYEPAADVVTAAERLAAASGAMVTITDDPYKAVADADAVYTDVWLSMGAPEAERAVRAAALRPYQVDSLLMAGAKSDAVFMHCLPAHRGEEVAASVIDGPASLVFAQAENRLHTAVAVLVALLDDRAS